MSRYKLVTIDPKFIAETVARTGSDELLDKATRSYVGIYDEETNWYIPLRANVSKHKPLIAYYLTPFNTNNPHFVRPGLDFQKALFVPKNSVIEINNTLPKRQSEFISENAMNIKLKFERYVLSMLSTRKDSIVYKLSTIPLFPEGIQRIKDKYLKQCLSENNYKPSILGKIKEYQEKESIKARDKPLKQVKHEKEQEL